ncbi:MAG: YbaN family protein [Coriobacteriia bacterium]|nr:YbaN family protein [Coriobacteriia bacterium]
MGRFSRPILIVCGWLCVGLGFVGVFLPVMPTTIFLIIAAWCFARSSERFHAWLIAHPLLGPYIRDYLSGKGMPLRAKIVALSLMWIACVSSAIIVVPVLVGDIAVIGCAVAGSWMILRTPTRRPGL